MPKPMITLPTSQMHALLIDTAKRRAPTQSRLDMLLRFERQLYVYGNLTPAMISTCQMTISSSR
ncbi:hypothetical protein ACQR1I_14275 [Bradyrhizobium sp. HKCCYLS2038]|uniref:hypothetical protein n=1 Tax=unclassified Bradyrhizobium TaxID=2631580 RepID=UPI003EB6F51E